MSDALNWDPALVPAEESLLTLGHDAPYTVTVIGTHRYAVSMGNPAASFVVDDGSNLTLLPGSLIQGTLRIGAGILDGVTSLLPPGDTGALVLSGTGTTQLNAATYSLTSITRIRNAAPNPTLLIDRGHTLTGRGVIERFTRLENRGLITTTAPIHKLDFLGGLEQSGDGTVYAADGSINFYSSDEIAGGTLRTSGPGMIIFNSTKWRGVTIAPGSVVRCASLVTLGEENIIDGTLSARNASGLTLSPDPTTRRLVLNSTGTGRIDSAAFTGAGPTDRLLLGAGLTLTGSTRISGFGTLQNESLLSSRQPSDQFTILVDITQPPTGSIVSTAGSVSLGDSTRGCSVTGGTISVSGSGKVYTPGARLTGVTLQTRDNRSITTSNARLENVTLTAGSTLTLESGNNVLVGDRNFIAGTLKLTANPSEVPPVTLSLDPGFRGNFLLTGGGSLLLKGTSSMPSSVQFRGNNAPGDVLTIDNGFTIAGMGQIVGFPSVINRGSVSVAASERLEAEGDWDMQGTGSVLASGGVISFVRGSLTNGTLASAESGVIEINSANLDRITIAPGSVVACRSGDLVLLGEQNLNNGGLTLSPTSGTTLSTALRPDPAGNGSIRLRGTGITELKSRSGDLTSAQILGPGTPGSTLTIDPGHTLQGRGKISGFGSIVNQGTIQGISTLVFDTDIVQSDSATIKGSFELGDNAVVGGTLTGGRLNGTRLVRVRVPTGSTVTIPSGRTGTLRGPDNVLDGLLYIDGADKTKPAVLKTDPDANNFVLRGTGTVQLGGASVSSPRSALIQGPGTPGATLTIAPGLTFGGNGSIAGFERVECGGTILFGTTTDPGMVEVLAPTLVLGPTARCVFDINWAGVPDTLSVRSMRLGGTIVVRAPTYINPAKGASYRIVTGTEITGTPDSMVLPPLQDPQSAWTVNITSTSIVLGVRCNRADLVSTAGEGLPDGLFTGSDVVAFFSAFFAGCEPGSVPCTRADITNLEGTGLSDGRLTASDVLVFMSLFFRGCG